MSAGSGTGHPNDERAVLIRALNGDADAFGNLYVLHLDAIYRYVYFRVGSQEEAEDLTGEVFVRAWEALPSYQIGVFPFKSWLYRIAHNLVVDHRRKRRPLSLPDEGIAETPSPHIAPEDLVALRQDAAALASAVKDLDDEEQQVIILRFVEGLSHREVADIIGKSEGASRVIQHRALGKLQGYLSSQKPSDE